MERIKTYSLIGLCLIIGCLMFYQTRLETQRDVFLAEKQLRDGQLLRLNELYGPLFIEKYKNTLGQVKVVKHFIPPEGSIITKVDKEKNVTTIIKNKGVCFRPGVGIGFYQKRMHILASSKVLYWGRYGGIINGDETGLSIGMSRYLDDVIPYWHPQNVEVFSAYKLINFTLQDETKVHVGIRISL